MEGEEVRKGQTSWILSLFKVWRMNHSEVQQKHNGRVCLIDYPTIQFVFFNVVLCFSLLQTEPNQTKTKVLSNLKHLVPSSDESLYHFSHPSLIWNKSVNSSDVSGLNDLSFQRIDLKVYRLMYGQSAACRLQCDRESLSTLQLRDRVTAHISVSTAAANYF